MSDKLNYEESISKLEKIVSELEKGKLSLDESLKKYEEGIKLASTCTKKLNEAKRKIELLVKKHGSPDEFELKPFNSDSETEE